MTRLPVIQRGCGSCTACCEALQVKSLDKADWERCKHLRRGPLKGCSIYKDRPKDCSIYECLWLAGIIEAADFRPDRCGFVLSASSSEDIGPYIMIHELRPGASMLPRAKTVLEAIGKAALVIEISREGIRKVRGGPSEQVEHMIAIAKEMSEKGVPGYFFEENK